MGSACDEVVGVLSLTAALAIDPAARLGPPAVAQTPGGRGGNAEGAGGTDAGQEGGPPQGLPATSPPGSPQRPRRSRRLRRQRRPRFARLPSHPRKIDPRDRAPRAALRARRSGDGGAGAGTDRVRGGRDLLPAHCKTAADAPPRSVELSALYLTNDPSGSADGVVARWAAIAMTVCPGWGFGATHLSLDLCAQAVGGLAAGHGSGGHEPGAPLPASGAPWERWRGSAFRLGGGFSVEAEVTLGIPLMERRFMTTTPEETVGETPVVALAGAIGIARRF